MDSQTLKSEVRDFWDQASCEEVYATGDSEQERYEAQSRTRFELQPWIHDFAKFQEGWCKDVLEVGVGMGADHIEWAKSKPNSLTGIDLTDRGINHTKKRLSIYGLESDVKTADAENMPFEDESFDIVYSWGVIHHSPNTEKAAAEISRVLRPGGVARVMIYHKYSLTGYMLWGRYGLMRGRPFRSLDDLYHHHLESPGTRAFTVKQANEMFAGCDTVRAWSQVSPGDLLEGAAGQNHQGAVLSVAKAIWPRFILRRLFKNHGLMLFIEARKEAT